MNQNSAPRATLGVFHLAMMSVAGIFTLRTLPLMAGYGLSSVFYYVVSALAFFIPSALVCAELATGWPKTGGLYVWVREAFGARVGFLAIWLEWTNTVISFPATLAFIAATLAYVMNPTLADNKYYMIAVMLVIFWGVTLVNFLGIRFSSWVSHIGLFLGTIFPGILMILLGFSWIYLGHHSQISITSHDILPHFKFTNTAFLAGLILGYSGMQVSAFHAQEAINPQHDYPRAMFIAAGIILFLSIFGSLAIAIVIPANQISLVAGLMQAAEAFFSAFHLKWLVPVVAVLTAIGILSLLNVWTIGPCKGLLATARAGDLPQVFNSINRFGAPTSLLIAQALIATFFSLIYLLMPSINSSYWILIALASLLTLIMWVIVFAAAIRLRYTHPNTPRAYKVPGKTLGIWIVAGLGMIICAITLVLGFIPPEQLKTGNLFFYESFLVGGVFIVSLIPFILPRIGR